MEMEDPDGDRTNSWLDRPKEMVPHPAQAVLRATLDALVVIDSRGVVVEWNPSAAQIFGYTRPEAIGVAIADLIIPDELRGSHRAGIERYLATGEAPVFDRRITMPALRSDGSQLTVELAITPVHGADEELFAGWLRDITEVEEAKADAARSAELLTAILHNVSDVITIFGADGSLKFLSGGIGERPPIPQPGGPMSLTTAVGTGSDLDVISLVHPDDVADTKSIFAAIVRGERLASQRWDVRTIETGGRIRTFETRGENLIDHPTVRGLIFSSRDVTAERASQQLIVSAESSARRLAEEQAAALKEVATLKAELLATVSHELRTPLTAILSFSDLLASRLGTAADEVPVTSIEPDSSGLEQLDLEEARDMVSVIERNGQLLTRLVDDLLLVGRLESGVVSVHPEEFEVAAFLDRLLAGVTPDAESLGITVEATVSGASPVFADQARITQVLQNLLVNSLKLAPDVTFVKIDATLTAAGWMFSVVDNGPGIDDETRAHIFDTFFRGPQPSTTAGSGLGLAVSQALVRLHGGEISVESAVGQGATFVFTLPKGSDPE